MSKTKLKDFADALPTFWKSSVLAQVGTSNIKVLKMNGQSYPAETHDYTEALVVLDGKMFLSVNGEPVEVAEGEMYLMRAEVPHAVEPGSHGTLMIIDPVMD
ncbi:cupin domain-containing protein [Pseudoduganella chitinolytica]|uniref:Cupin domain-containing protein n=1 Tax=Pseudoduganella chitinolytica TaxID=34070 RepID=A0ABY8BCJ6_9BURK|nr:cupin domain-containing protein [Pseudoduganella chitinolytica]WEF33535.1 cupin domain-containing protein [Pseudoduganella chitinolytica]